MLSALLLRLQRWRSQPVSAQIIRRTLHQIGVHGYHPRRKPLLKTIHKKARSLLKTRQQITWITWTMFYGLVRWRLIYFVPMASSICGGDQVRSTKISVSCLQSKMVVGMSWYGAAWVLQELEGYISLSEAWTPTFTVKCCSREWSPPSSNWVTGQISSITMTPNTPPRRPLLYWRDWG